MVISLVPLLAARKAQRVKHQPTKWSNTLKQFVTKLPSNCLSVFDHFVGLALKGLSNDFYSLKNRNI